MNNLLSVLQGKDASQSTSKSKTSISSVSTATTKSSVSTSSTSRSSSSSSKKKGSEKSSSKKAKTLASTTSSALKYVAKESESVDLVASKGRWCTFNGLQFTDYEMECGSTKQNGKLAVQCFSGGNRVVPFRCGAHPLGFDAVTILRLFAPSKLDNRLSIGVVNEEYADYVGSAASHNDPLSRMVCNEKTGVGVVVTLDDFPVKKGSKTNEHVALVVQIDRIHNELIVFHQHGEGGAVDADLDTYSIGEISYEDDDDTASGSQVLHLESVCDDDNREGSDPKQSRSLLGSLLPGRRKKTDTTAPRRQAASPPLVGKTNGQTFFDETSDTLISRVPIPKHWRKVFFAVDLYGKGDEIKISQQCHQYRLMRRKVHKKGKPKFQQPWEQALTSRERKLVEGLFSLSNDGVSSSLGEDLPGSKRLSHRRNKTGGNMYPETSRAARAVTLGAFDQPTEHAVDWRSGYMPLVGRSALALLLPALDKGRKKASVVDLARAYKFQHWVYRMAVAMKPTVTLRGHPVSREPMLSNAAVQQRSLHRRGVTLRLLRDLPNQCGLFATSPESTVRDVAVQLCAWSQPYWCSPAEVLGSLDAYLVNQEPLGKEDISGGGSFDRYVSKEVSKPDWYVSYPWEMRWSQLTGFELAQGMAKYEPDTSFWIDVVSFNYVSRVISIDAEKVDGEGWVLASTNKVIQLIGNTLLVLDSRGSSLHRLWCLYEVLATLAFGGSVSLCFLANSERDVCLLALYVAAGGFDHLVDLEAAQVNVTSGKLKKQMLAQVKEELGYKSPADANEQVKKAIKASAKSFLLQHSNGFKTEAEVQNGVAKVTSLGVDTLFDPKTGDKNQNQWLKLESFI